jgi:membrane protease YdiL (CAAX protease family)
MVLVCLAAGAFFFSSLDSLWPLVDLDLTIAPSSLRDGARAFLVRMGHDVAGYRSASGLGLDTEALDYVEDRFGRERAQRWIGDGWPLVHHYVYFKKRGETVRYVVRVHPARGVIGWTKVVPEDHPGDRPSLERARDLARAALRTGLGIDPERLEEQSVSTDERPGHRLHRFGYERLLPADDPRLRERVSVTVAGSEVIGASRRLVVPEAERRRTRAREAPRIALETAGFLLAGIAAVAAFFIFLSRLRHGAVSLRRVAIWPALVFVCLMGAAMLRSARLFAEWDPLWPRWVSDFRFFTLAAVEQVWLLPVLLAFVAAGDALDDRLGAGRGAALGALGRGRLLDPAVARASGRGFLVGLLCGGVMALAVVALQLVAGGTTVLQPRGFFLYTLNTAAPAGATLLFFFGIALAEELGYRYFGAGWLLTLTGRRWVAAAVPAVLYGLTHTRMDFLPPAEPFWGRALVLTLVGLVWGWAFLRYDALTVVLSHFTADLFIFNWPQLASGKPGPFAASALALSLPLAPWILRALLRLAGRAPG